MSSLLVLKNSVFQQANCEDPKQIFRPRNEPGASEILHQLENYEGIYER